MTASRPAVPRVTVSSSALSHLFLLIIAIQGFHVVEHIVLVIQVEGFSMGLDEAHGLLGAWIDFEWLHFSYNLAFLGVLALLLTYGLRNRSGLGRPTRFLTAALAGATALQTYHVVEHIVRVVQYLNTGCTPCQGLIGQVVLFIWPHLVFGIAAYVPMVACFFAYGLHRNLWSAASTEKDHSLAVDPGSQEMSSG